jgi:hypothetical protein
VGRTNWIAVYRAVGSGPTLVDCLDHCAEFRQRAIIELRVFRIKRCLNAGYTRYNRYLAQSLATAAI